MQLQGFLNTLLQLWFLLMTMALLPARRRSNENAKESKTD
jgi:hypothetical protein